MSFPARNSISSLDEGQGGVEGSQRSFSSLGEGRSGDGNRDTDPVEESAYIISRYVILNFQLTHTLLIY
jgi:hypothetical protein